MENISFNSLAESVLHNCNTFKNFLYKSNLRENYMPLFDGVSKFGDILDTDTDGYDSLGDYSSSYVTIASSYSDTSLRADNVSINKNL